MLVGSLTASSTTSASTTTPARRRRLRMTIVKARQSRITGLTRARAQSRTTTPPALIRAQHQWGGGGWMKLPQVQQILLQLRMNQEMGIMASQITVQII